MPPQLTLGLGTVNPDSQSHWLPNILDRQHPSVPLALTTRGLFPALWKIWVSLKLKKEGPYCGVGRIADYHRALGGSPPERGARDAPSAGNRVWREGGTLASCPHSLPELWHTREHLLAPGILYTLPWICSIIVSARTREGKLELFSCKQRDNFC
jgi:hypothetical protein